MSLRGTGYEAGELVFFVVGVDWVWSVGVQFFCLWGVMGDDGWCGFSVGEPVA